MARRPGGERKDALDTAVASRRRCRAQVASVAAAASAASLGVKPQAEAPHSAPDAPRGALRRRLRRRTTSSARARTQSHRLVAARARAGPTWESERSSSVTSRRAAKAARAQVEGKWRGNWEPLRPPTRLEPAAAGRRRAARRSMRKKGRTQHGARIKGGPSQYPEEAAALAFFRVPRIWSCSMEAVSRSSPMSTPFRMSTSRESLHTETPSHSSSFLRNEGVAALRVHARPSLRSTSRCRWCWTPISTASGSTRPTLHRTSAPTLHGRVPPSLSRPTPPPSSWLLPQRRTHLQLSRSGANWVLIRLFPLPSSHAALPPWNWRRPILSPPARSLQSSILGGLSYLCCHGHRG